MLDAWTYCPRCGSELTHHGSSVVCGACGLTLYAHSAVTASALPVDDDGHVLLARRAGEPFLGLYARLVHRREHHRRRRAALARARSWLILLTHREPLGITIDGEPTDTRLVLVANNRYELELPTIGAREQLDDGALYLYLLGGAANGKRGRRFEIDAKAGRLEAAVDGEPEVLETPIEFRVEPRALRVLVPPRR